MTHQEFNLSTNAERFHQGYCTASVAYEELYGFTKQVIQENNRLRTELTKAKTPPKTEGKK